MGKLFSTLYKTFSTSGIESVKNSINSELHYRLNEYNIPDTTNTSSSSGGDVANTPGTTTDPNAMSYPDVDMTSAPQSSSQPTDPQNIPVMEPTQTGQSTGSKTLGMLKKAGSSILGAPGKAANFLAHGDSTGGGAKQIDAVLKQPEDEQNQVILQQLLSQVPGIETNGLPSRPDITDRLLTLLAQTLQLPGNNIQNNSTDITQSPITENRFGKIMSRVGKGLQTGADKLNTFKTAVGNLHQATGGRYGTGPDRMTDLVSGKLQQQNAREKNMNDLFKVLYTQPAAVQQHPAWSQFMKTATQQEKQQLYDAVYKILNTPPGPPQP